MEITIAREVTDELMDAFARLVPQLSTTNVAPTRAELEEMVGSSCDIVFMAREEGRFVGSLTLILFRVPTGLRAWIEDVVVDNEMRGRGIGEALTRAAIEEARRRGAKTVDLTSRPAREAANRLYQRIGFEQRNTNVYRYRLPRE
jgi:ribosomal protein S18 acetylase RimI-like enzyme